MSCIVVGTDLSENANQALKTAFSFALKLNIKVNVVHCRVPLDQLIPVYSGVTYSFDHSIDEAALDQQIQSAINKTIDKIKAENTSFSKVNSESHILKGDTSIKLNEFTKLNNAQLLVVGLKGQGILEEIFIGSTASRILNTVAISTLCISNKIGEGFKRPILCVDFLKEDLQPIEFAKKIFTDKNQTITLLNVITPSYVTDALSDSNNNLNSLNEALEKCTEKSTNKMAKLAKGFTCNIETEVKTIDNKSSSESILKFIEEQDSDLIITGNRGRNGLKKFFLGSVSEYLAKRSNRSILICK